MVRTLNTPLNPTYAARANHTGRGRQSKSAVHPRRCGERAHSPPALRAIRTERTSRLEFSTDNVMGEFGTATDLYFGGDMEASIALTGQVAGRIDAVRPVAEVIAEVRKEFFEVVDTLARQYL